MGCNVLNLLYQLDISLVEICFIYTLKFRIEGHLSMSTHSPRLQFVIGLLASSKTEAKWVVLVEGPWYETSDSPRLPFDLNQSLMLLVSHPEPPPRRMKGARNYTGTLYLLFQTLVGPSLITESKYHIQIYKYTK